MILAVLVILLARGSLAQISDAFLWVYFIGDVTNPSEEQIRFAISTNGFDFTTLNNNQPIISSAEIADKKAIRDPHIMRCEDGETFYMVATDMMAEEGWNSNHGIVMLKSKDLITWSHARVDMHTAYPREFGDVDQFWAPETIYDPNEKKYMVYFSMHKPGDVEKIYYSYANADFTALETVPKQLYYPQDGLNTIDGNIVKKDEKYYLFYKTQDHGDNIARAIADNLTGPYVLGNPAIVQQTKDVAEGPCCYALGNGTYVLIYDVYGARRYDFCTSTDLINFTQVNKGTMQGFKPKHGTVMPITTVEMDRLIAKWG